MTKNFRFYSAVIVNGKEYQDHEMAQLIGKDVTGWRFAGDCPQEDCNFCVSDSSGNCNVISFEAFGQQALPHALTIVRCLLNEGYVLETD